MKVKKKKRMLCEVKKKNKMHALTQEGFGTENPSEISRKLEPISMKLQRTNANVWNAFVYIFLSKLL